MKTKEAFPERRELDRIDKQLAYLDGKLDVVLNMPRGEFNPKNMYEASLESHYLLGRSEQAVIEELFRS